VSVTSDASPVTVERAEGAINVLVEKPTTDFELTFQVRGVPGRSGDEDLEIVSDSSLFLLWSDRFYPIDFNDWALLRMRIKLPENFNVVAPGRLLETQRDNDRIEYTFQTSAPVVCFSVLADSRWIKTEKRIRFLRMQTYLYPESQKFAGRIFSSSYDVVAFYSQIYCLYPFDRFTFVTIKNLHARRAFPGFVAYSPEYLEKEMTATGHDAHETALLWWDYTTRGMGPGAFQWTEGFGDYAELLYDETRGKLMPSIFETFRAKYLARPPEEDLLYYELKGNTPQDIVHGKFPWLMRVMQFVVGDAPFKNAMALLFYDYRFRAFSMDELVSVLEKGSGQSLKWWREEWLERRGVPAISFKYDAARDKSDYKVTVVLRQVGPVYHLPMEIGIKTAKGLRIEKVNVNSQESTFTFRSVDQPEEVLLDPNRWIIMRTTYEKSAE